MTRLTQEQQATLRKMPSYHIVAQFVTGAVVVAYDQSYQDARVIDIDGQVYAFSRHLAIMDQRA